MTHAPPVSVVLPAYDEAAAVGPQVEALRKALEAHDVPHEIIVVDDGSRDRTAEEAHHAGARVLRHGENRGYGAALKTGILAAGHDTIVIMDADGTYPVREVPALLAALATADMVVGARVGARVHIPTVRRPAKRLLGLLARFVAGQPIQDLNSGLRAFRRDCVRQYFSLLSNRFSFTTTLTLALLADDHRVVYHPIDYYPRVGTSKVMPWHFLDFVILSLRMAMLFHPLRIILPVASLCALMGGLKVLFDLMALFQRAAAPGWSLLFQPVLSTSAVLLLLSALQLLLVGMVADGLLRRTAQHACPLSPPRVVPAAETSDPAPPGVRHHGAAG